uniref:mitochondrial-processing peptidase subunit alpha-like n=1 Tax=Ciona intestinalis TaxID=7719 RepID=UPI00006A3966|nr:mitochondrial-processing peptidase subunit alpha-like [Ciona intestinalis]|eukprot:XP_002119957.1 mitochondrial-processing peptidase subunit alpha-like [Ciona intestinalis]
MAGRMSRNAGRYYRSLRKSFSTSSCLSYGESPTNSDVMTTPLSVPLRDSPKPIYAESASETFQTMTSKLNNGLTVTSQPKFGTFCTVGILIDAGSRHEVAYPSGMSHYLERCAFAGSSIYKDRDAVMLAVEKLGGICDCQSSRDTTIYAASVDRDKLEPLMELLADSVYQPTLDDNIIEQARESINYELDELDKKPDPEPMMTELIHEAGFRGNTVGLPKYPQAETLHQINRASLQKFLRSYYLPERMVVAGVGVDHDELVTLSEKYVSAAAKSPSWSLDGARESDASVAQYTGGDVKVQKHFDLSMSVVPMPELAHVSIGMESVKFTDTNFVPFAVLNMLMGGGGSFSAGGPGKGMFSRLYLNVLNRHHWMYAATAYHHSYDDGGLFCIQGSAHPSQLRECVHVITQEFAKLTNGIDKVELNRAKKQLQSMLMMNLEARPVIFEDVGRQILATGERKSPKQLCEMIDNVSNDDIVRVARHMLSSRPAVAALGDVKQLPDYEDIENALTRPDGKLPKKFRLFGR